MSRILLWFVLLWFFKAHSLLIFPFIEYLISYSFHNLFEFINSVINSSFVMIWSFAKAIICVFHKIQVFNIRNNPEQIVVSFWLIVVEITFYFTLNIWTTPSHDMYYLFLHF